MFIFVSGIQFILNMFYLFFVVTFRFEDIFNTSEFKEQMGQSHAVVEHHLGIL